MATELRFDEVLRVLTRNEVEFIVVGGIAAILQGSPLTTEDIDIVYRPSEENIARLARALGELEAIYFDPAGRHIAPDVSRLASLRMHLLNTSCGRVDVLRTVGDDLGFEDLVDRTRVFDVAEFRVRALDLETIIETKEHAARPKDRYQLLFLRQLVAEIRRRDPY
ncbi:MAG: nucleotidyl transferase AbiEii/AbiGii toxin family protein [bacterium]|nr:nucleotidyl transferase AbiEii/AbiGii toxin family protein [bacterium]